MSRSPFGWSYPPGCSGPPEYPEDCTVCGAASIDSCVCPECPECGTHGDPQCYDPADAGGHGMTLTAEQLATRAKREEFDREQAAADEARARWEAEQGNVDPWDGFEP